jgi:hypothetical protein
MRIEVAAPRTEVEEALTAHLGPSWNEQLNLSEVAAPSQGQGRRLGEVPATEMISIISAVGAAAASGVIGNLTYDALKGLITFLRRRFGAANVSEDLKK